MGWEGGVVEKRFTQQVKSLQPSNIFCAMKFNRRATELTTYNVAPTDPIFARPL